MYYYYYVPWQETERSCICVFEDEFEDTKGVISIRHSKKDRQHNDQKNKDNRKINGLQNTTQTNKDRATRISRQTEGELSCSGRVGSIAPLVAPVVLLKWVLSILSLPTIFCLILKVYRHCGIFYYLKKGVVIL